jgi:hypothetical protein
MLQVVMAQHFAKHGNRSKAILLRHVFDQSGIQLSKHRLLLLLRDI